MVIAVDVFGGDHAPEAILEGCAAALEKNADVSLLLCGLEAVMAPVCARLGISPERARFLDAPEVIANDELPVEAIRLKKKSSVVMGLEALASGQAAAFVSAGSTGAVLAGATLIVRRVKGVQRPALAPLLPTPDGKGVLLIDCGANVDCKPAYLCQFAVMGSVYMHGVMGAPSPRVGLLNNGAEAEKGNALTKEAFALLRETPVNFIGNIEARDALSGEADVIVTDGFAGNILLKSAEGFAGVFSAILKKHLTGSLRAKIGALLAKPAFASFKRQLDYTEYGGAPLLGLNGCVIKAHGSSNAKAFTAAILQAKNCVLSDVTGNIFRGIERLPKA